MDGSRFDALSRSLGVGQSRRALTRFLGGVAVVGPLALLGLAETTAKKTPKVTICHAGQTMRVRTKAKTKHLKHGDTLGACPSRRTPICTPSCAGKDCGPDGCGGSCGSCIGGTCSAGTCVCPSGTKNCGGACFNTGGDPRHCGDCGVRCEANEHCRAGQCACLSSGDRCDPGYTCCPADNSCKCRMDQYLDPTTCTSVAACPPGSTPCVSESAFQCGITESGPSRVCCPSGTTCTAQGTCVQ